MVRVVQAMTIERAWKAVLLTMGLMVALSIAEPKALAEPGSDWTLLQGAERGGAASWAKRLSITDRGLPVVLLEERAGTGSQSLIRYLITVHCKEGLQAIRQFWSRGEARWQVVDPLEWQTAEDGRMRQILALACRPSG